MPQMQNIPKTGKLRLRQALQEPRFAPPRLSLPPNPPVKLAETGPAPPPQPRKYDRIEL